MVLLHDKLVSTASTRCPTVCSPNSRGSILLLTVILLSLLSVLLLLVTNSILLGTQARESLRTSLEMLYIAEAGLAHGQAFCVAHGETSPLLAEGRRRGGGERA